MFQFSEKLRSDFRDIEREMFNSTDKIIIDLRNNPGGFLHVATDLAGWFLERGDVIVIEDFGSSDNQEIHKARGNSRFRDHEIVILINEGTASASEILAGALQDYGYATIIGEQTFGKGSVQEYYELPDGSALKITVAEWLTPFGRSINEVGITPDIEVEYTIENYEAGETPQLDAAIDFLTASRS